MNSRVRLRNDVVGILDDLCNRREETHEKLVSLSRLGSFVEAQALTLPRHVFLGFMRDLYSRIGIMLTSRGRNQTKGGVRAVAELIGVNLKGEEASKTRRLAQLLSTAIETILTSALEDAPSQDHETYIQSLCKVFGTLVKVQDPVAAGIASEQTEKALNQIGEDAVVCFAAFSMLNEMAENAPAQFNLHVETFLQKVAVGIFHEDEGVRQAALQGLNVVVRQRNARGREEWYKDLVNNCLDKAGDASHSGGSGETNKALQGLRTVLSCPEAPTNCTSSEWFNAIDRMVESFRENPEPEIQSAVVQLIPVLAALNPNTTNRGPFDAYMERLIRPLEKEEEDEAVIFAAVVDLAMVYEPREELQLAELLLPWLDRIGAAIRRVLSGNDMDEAAAGKGLMCCNFLCGVMGNVWEASALELLFLGLKRGLSRALLDCIENFVDEYPVGLEAIGDSLVEVVKLTLEEEQANGGWKQTVLALEVIASFPLNMDMAFLRFFHRRMDEILYDLDIVELRMMGYEACLAVIGECAHSQGYSNAEEQACILEDLLDHIATVAVMDPCQGIRLELMKSLLGRRDLFPQMAQDRIMSRLAQGLQDDFAPAQEVFIRLLCELAQWNNACAMPALRALLMKVLVDLEITGIPGTVGKLVAGSARVLSTLLRGAPQVLKSHEEKVLEMIVSKLEHNVFHRKPCTSVKDPTGTTIDELFMCLSALGDAVAGYTKRIGPVLTKVVVDASDRDSQMIAVQTLDKVASSVGGAILPHIDIEKIVFAMVHIIEMSTEIECHGLMRTLEVLCLLDPGVTQLLESSDEEFRNADEGRESELFSSLFEAARGDMEDHYTSIVINALMRAFKDPGGRADCSSIVKCLMSVFTTHKHTSAQHLDMVVPFILTIIMDADEDLRLILFDDLCKFAEIIGPNLMPFSEDILKLCMRFWGESKQLTKHILILLAELYRVLNHDKFAMHMQQLVPKVAALFSESQRTGEYQLVGPAFTVLQSCKGELHHLPLLLPIMSQFIRTPAPPGGEVPTDVKKGYLQTLIRLLPAVEMDQNECYLFAGQTLLSLIDLLRNEAILREPTVDAMSCVMGVLGPEGMSSFTGVIEEAVQNSGMEDASIKKFMRVLERSSDVNRVEAVGCSCSRTEADERSEQPQASSSTSSSITTPAAQNGVVRSGGTNGSFKVNMKALSKTRECTTGEDWAEWMRGLSEELLRQSPSATLRACHGLAQVNAGFSRRLFPASLISCWSVLEEQHRAQLQRTLMNALMVENIPSEVLDHTLNLECLIRLGPVKGLPDALQSLRLFAQRCVTMAKFQRHSRLNR
ncbi:hypothetical protein BSKO_00385 [Bryopsis sp. KO-2023]|nr:hypothetical protein BSKO_00385 [Bryopsis sp. KO-2023]